MARSENGGPFVGVAEVAKMFGISESSVRRRLAPGYIPRGLEPDLRSCVACKICRKWLFSRSALESLFGLA